MYMYVCMYVCMYVYIYIYIYIYICSCSSAALVGGMVSIDLAFDVNMCFLAESTVVSSLLRPYISTTYDSSTDMQTLSKLVGS